MINPDGGPHSTVASYFEEMATQRRLRRPPEGNYHFSGAPYLSSEFSTYDGCGNSHIKRF